MTAARPTGLRHPPLPTPPCAPGERPAWRHTEICTDRYSRTGTAPPPMLPGPGGYEVRSGSGPAPALRTARWRLARCRHRAAQPAGVDVRSAAAYAPAPGAQLFRWWRRPVAWRATP